MLDEVLADGLQQLFCVAVPDLSTIEEEPMQFSIFSVADHYPEEPRTIRELYAQILDEMD